MAEISALISLLIQHNAGEPEKINHIMKVYSFAHIIAVEENVDENTRQVIEMASVVCDIGENGIASASVSDMLLLNLGYNRDIIERVHNLVLKNANYENIVGVDYQILAEANFLVSAFENRLDKESIVGVLNNVFKTHSGRQFLQDIFSVRERTTL